MEEKLCAELELIEDNRMQTIVNGVHVKTKIAVLKCAYCDNILFNLGNGIVDYGMAYEFLTSNKIAIQNKMKYCPNCGKEFGIPTLIEEIVDT